MRRSQPVPEPGDEPRADALAGLDDEPEQDDDDGYFVLPLEVLEHWRASADARR